MTNRAENDRKTAAKLDDESTLEGIFGEPLPPNPVPLHERLGLKRGGTTPVTIRLDVDDLERAKEVATSKGVGYQTLLKAIIHDALEQLAS